jgi:hypothetical protein
MHDMEVLRTMALAALRAGKLPNRAPDASWGGPGTGAQCSVCETAINSDDAEWELEFAEDSGPPPPATYFLHVHCHAAWDLARRDLTPGNSTISPSVDRRPVISLSDVDKADYMAGRGCGRRS